jgi:hypothetical protein
MVKLADSAVVEMVFEVRLLLASRFTALEICNLYVPAKAPTRRLGNEIRPPSDEAVLPEMNIGVEPLVGTAFKVTDVVVVPITGFPLAS